MSRLSLILTLLLLTTTIASTASAQAPLTVKASVDTDRATVGGRIKLTIVVGQAAGVQVELPQPPLSLGDLEVLESHPPQEVAKPDGRKELHLTYILAPFRTGDLVLMPPPIAYTAISGVRETLAAGPIAIRVDSVLPTNGAQADIRDLKPQLSLPGEPVPFPRTLIASLIALAVALTTAVFLRRRQRRPRPQPTPPPRALSPEEVAQAELERIAALDLIARGDYKGFYSRLAPCVRRYLTERYSFPAVAMTTAELEAQMIRHGVGRWQARLASGLLSECDAVVYARYVPAQARAESALAMAYEMVATEGLTGPEALTQGVSG